MHTTIRNSIILMVLVLAGCGSNSTTGGEAATVTSNKTASLAVPVTQLPDGAALYATNCAGCHAALASSTKTGRDTTRIQNAIISNSGGMGFLSTLTATDIQAIATAIAPVPTGAAIYKNDCMGCHGGLSTTVKAGADSVRIQNSIVNNSGGMGFLSTLSPLQVQALAATLAVATGGSSLYASNCAGCHGIIVKSTKTGADFSRTRNAISSNAGNMGYLSTLTDADIQAISAVLVAP